MKTLKVRKNDMMGLVTNALNHSSLVRQTVELEADDWDKQMEQDAKAGKLDALGARALEHYRAGRVTEI